MCNPICKTVSLLPVGESFNPNMPFIVTALFDENMDFLPFKSDIATSSLYQKVYAIQYNKCIAPLASPFSISLASPTHTTQKFGSGGEPLGMDSHDGYSITGTINLPMAQRDLPLYLLDNIELSSYLEPQKILLEDLTSESVSFITIQQYTEKRDLRKFPHED